MGFYYINNVTYPITTVSSTGVTRFFRRNQAEQELKSLQRELFKHPHDTKIKLRMIELRKYLKDTAPKQKNKKPRN